MKQALLITALAFTAFIITSRPNEAATSTKLDKLQCRAAALIGRLKHALRHGLTDLNSDTYYEAFEDGSEAPVLGS